MNPTVIAWSSLAASLLLIVACEVRPHRAGVQAMAAQPAFEIVAVQAPRNSLMSATVVASTAALVRVPATLALLIALHFFDQPTPVEIG